MPVSRLPFALEDLLREIHIVSGIDVDADVTLMLDERSFHHVIGELQSHNSGLFTVVMHPGCPPEHRYKGVSIVKREDAGG